MAYEPPRGLIVSVTRADHPTGPSRRFHLSLSCGQQKAAEKQRALAKKGVDTTVTLSAPVLIGVARGTRGVVICNRCVPKEMRLEHAASSDRDIRTVSGGLPTLGKRP